MVAVQGRGAHAAGVKAVLVDDGQAVQQPQRRAACLLRVGAARQVPGGIQVQRDQRIHLGVALCDALDMRVQQLPRAQMACENLLAQRGGGSVAKFGCHGLKY